MCKTYDAIYKISQHAESNILICCVGNATIEGELHRCNCDFDNDRCYDGVVTLENVVVVCNETKEIKEYKWLNIPSRHILSFAFKCCEK